MKFWQLKALFAAAVFGGAFGLSGCGAPGSLAENSPEDSVDDARQGLIGTVNSGASARSGVVRPTLPKP